LRAASLTTAAASGRTRPGDHSPGLSSKLDVRLSHSSSFPADGPCQGTALVYRPGRSLPGQANKAHRRSSTAPPFQREGHNGLALATLPQRGAQGDAALGCLCPPSARQPRQHIPRLSRGPSLLGQSHPPPHAPDRLLPRGEAAGGYSVPEGRLTLRAGRHFSPGGFRGERRPEIGASRPRTARAVPPPLPFGSSLSTGFGWLALTTIQACLHGRCPFVAELGGVPGPVRGYRLLSHAPPRRAGQAPWGGTRFTGSPPGWESHPHGLRVVRGLPAPLRLIPKPL